MSYAYVFCFLWLSGYIWRVKINISYWSILNHLILIARILISCLTRTIVRNGLVNTAVKPLVMKNIFIIQASFQYG